MPSFYEYMMRHGEFGAQDLVERLERYAGIKASVHVSLEQRWAAVVEAPQAANPQEMFEAA